MPLLKKKRYKKLKQMNSLIKFMMVQQTNFFQLYLDVKKRVFLLLWEIAIFKLLIPFSIPSTFSIYTLFKPKQSVKLPNVPETVFIPTANLTTFITTPMPIQETFSIPIWKIIWFIGMVLCFVGFISAYIICYRRFRYATITKNAFILNMK